MKNRDSFQDRRKPPVNWLRQAVTEDDNKTIDRPFLLVVMTVFCVLPFVLLSMIGLAAVDVIHNHKDYNPAALGGGVAAVLAGVAAFVASMAALLYQDKKYAAPPPPQSTLLGN
jgi:hypothetical protein